MSNIKSAAWYAGASGSGAMLPGANWADNNMFYVDDQNGTDVATNSNGLYPTRAFQTITYALSQCTAARNAYIIVLNYGHDPTLESWPISIDKHHVQIIAAERGSFIGAVTIDSDGDTDCFSIEAHCIRIQGFFIRAGASKSGITFSGHVIQPAIHNCHFDAGATYGIYSPSGGISHGLDVTGCTFIAPSSHGIYINDDLATGRFKDNVFTLNIDNSVGIEVTAGGNTQILDNRFTTADASPANGWGITMSGTAQDAMIDGNVGMIGKTDPGATPFLDTTAAGTCNWGLNYGGIVALYAT
jgi:hypothetical protein